MQALCPAYWVEYIYDYSYSEPIYHYCVLDPHEGQHECFCCKERFD